MSAEEKEKRAIEALISTSAAEGSGEEFPAHDDTENPPDYSTLRDDYWKLRTALASERERTRELEAEILRLKTLTPQKQPPEETGTP